MGKPFEKREFKKRPLPDLNISAVTVLNAGNIQVTGSSGGVPAGPTVAAPSLAGLSDASSTSAATNSGATEVAKQSRNNAAPGEMPSLITVELLGYGGGEATPQAPTNDQSGETEEERERKRKQQPQEEAPATSPRDTVQTGESRHQAGP